jgi:hypothetical protein
MDLDMYVRGFDVSPTEIERDYSVRISFELVDPVLQLQQREMGLREVQAGVKSRETYWNADARLEDASGERKRLLEDFVRSDPMVQKVLAQEVAREIGLLELLEKQRAKEEQAQQQGGGPSVLDESILGGDLAGGGLGGGGMPGMPPAAPAGGPQRSPRAPLTPDVASPSRVGQEFAG